MQDFERARHENDNIYTYEMPKLTDDEMAWDDKFETDSKEEEE